MARYFEEFEIGEKFVSPARTVTETDIVLFAPFRPKKCSDWFSFRKEIGKGSNSECRTSGFGLYNIHAIDDALSLFGQNIQNIVQHFTRYE